jgi:hypothetical protein
MDLLENSDDITNTMEMLTLDWKFNYNKDSLYKMSLLHYKNNNIDYCIQLLKNNSTHKESMHFLGNYYSNIDVKVAFQYYYMNINKNYVPSVYKVAISLFNGIGISKNPVEGVRLLKLIYDRCSDAYFMLGYCYYMGIGTDVDRDKAYIMFKELWEKKDTHIFLDSDRVYGTITRLLGEYHTNKKTCIMYDTHLNKQCTCNKQQALEYYKCSWLNYRNKDSLLGLSKCYIDLKMKEGLPLLNTTYKITGDLTCLLIMVDYYSEINKNFSIFLNNLFITMSINKPNKLYDIGMLYDLYTKGGDSITLNDAQISTLSTSSSSSSSSSNNLSYSNNLDRSFISPLNLSDNSLSYSPNNSLSSSDNLSNNSSNNSSNDLDIYLNDSLDSHQIIVGI